MLTVSLSFRGLNEKRHKMEHTYARRCYRPCRDEDRMDIDTDIHRRSSHNGRRTQGLPLQRIRLCLKQSSALIDSWQTRKQYPPLT